MIELTVEAATQNDLNDMLIIYNEGIEDRIATLETKQKDIAYMNEWFSSHQGRYQVIIAKHAEEIVGWASLNQYNPREAYRGVADLSVYIKREYRGKGAGGKLLESLESIAKEHDFHKIVLFTFSFNKLGQGLYQKRGYREVGIFKQQGMLDGAFVDVMAMEKLL